MKLKNIFKIAAIAVAAGSTLTGVTSCNYLDVIPPEQAKLSDAMKDHDKAMGFLHSCYAGLNMVQMDGRSYYGGPFFNNSTDEYVLPEGWMDSEWLSFYIMRNTVSSSHLGNWEWGHFYKYIGQCILFENQLNTVGAANHVWNDEAEKALWLAETKFLKAAYHFFMLRQYGPVPITTDLISMDAGLGEYPGRDHFDYCVNHIVTELDEACKTFEDQGLYTRSEIETGRASATICKALKARVLLYAASDLWNGSFPFPTWKNEKFTTPGNSPYTGQPYGQELVERTFQAQKWIDAYDACKDALKMALAQDYYLWNEATIPSDTEVKPTDIYVPVPEGADPVSEEFLNKVSTMRYAVSTNQNEGNHEIIWSNYMTPSWYVRSRLPKNVFTTAKGKQKLGWNGVAPTLESVEAFLTDEGTMPTQDQKAMGCAPADFYKKAGLTTAGREEVMRICLNREPRFYAWIAFHNGDYLTVLRDGKPKTLDFVNPEEQGRETGATLARNYSATGFLSMKHIDPKTKFSSGDESDDISEGGTPSPCVLIRMAELYLNIAECAAELSARGLASAKYPGDYRQEAIDMVNVIRERAGAHVLDQNILSSFPQTSLLEWVRRERWIELWNEGHRYFDVRRWMQGNQYFGANKRHGLNGTGFEQTFEQWATPVNLDVQFRWHNRLSVSPVFINEVYKNPQMVQAPGY